jgi:adenine phosphoribosyltransferase
MGELVNDVKAAIRDVPDFPKPGILFKDITPVLADASLFKRVTRWFADQIRFDGVQTIVAIESRGFLFGAPLVEELGAGLAPARKAGKLPYECVSVSYALEYGEATLQMHVDAITPGARVVILDDLLATGGTAEATVELVRKLGGEVVAMLFVVELGFLGGRERLGHLNVPIKALAQY